MQFAEALSGHKHARYRSTFRAGTVIGLEHFRELARNVKERHQSTVRALTQSARKNRGAGTHLGQETSLHVAGAI
jgi:hypothetical protein